MAGIRRRDFIAAVGSTPLRVFQRYGSRPVYSDHLNGANPADLPAQAPVKYEFAINLNTARSLSLNVSPTLLALADEVIE
jgi:putative ABC transport system substrate-binding protein